MRLKVCVLVHLRVLGVQLIDLSHVHRKDELNIILMQQIISESLPVDRDVLSEAHEIVLVKHVEGLMNLYTIVVKLIVIEVAAIPSDSRLVVKMLGHSHANFKKHESSEARFVFFFQISRVLVDIP